MKRVFTVLRKTSKIIIVCLVLVMIQKSGAVSSKQKLYNESINKTLDLTAMAVKLKEINLHDKYEPLDSFSGDLTGYAADCPLCNGHLGCTGQDVRDGTTTYLDKSYGEVRIVASSKHLACGSIVKFNYGKKNVYAIVLDRGVLGNDLDLLVESEGYASKYVGRRKISYDVLRFGWERKL